jgi:SAM-dependent methyltransferase
MESKCTKDIIKIKYFDIDVFHLNKSITTIKNKNDEEQPAYVNWTGLTTNRPFLIIEYLINNNIINNNDNILDIGCGGAEMGVEINRRKYNLNYTGLEINTVLNEINRLNLQKYNFIDFDINFDKIAYENKYNIIMMMGCTEVCSKISLSINSIDTEYKPKYIICETHVNRKENLNTIIKSLNDYEIILNYNFDIINNINRQDYAPAYKRIMFILVKV